MNFIKSSSLINRLFKKMSEEMDSDIDNFLYNTQILWLSKVKVVKRVYSLKDDIIICLREQNMIELTMQWEEYIFILEFSYLVDMFDLINTLNSYLIDNIYLYII